MKATFIEPEARLGAQRGETVVCIPVYGGYEHFVQCMESVLAHTPPDIRILICDDADPDGRAQTYVETLPQRRESGHDVSYLKRERNLGFPGNVNGAFAISAPADVVLLNSDCVVAEGWFEGLRDAVSVDSRVATATALTNHGTIVSLPGRGRPAPFPPGWDLDAAAAAVRSHSLRLRPRLPTAIGHCVYIRRAALELVGDFDLAFTPGYGEEVDFSLRCVRSGLCHVLADEVLVWHHGGASFGANGNRSPIQEQHELIIAARYPYYHQAVRLFADDVGSPLSRALSIARRALRPLSVVIDARVLEGPMTGTQLHVLELIAALARSGKAQVSAIITEAVKGSVAEALARMAGVQLLVRAELDEKRLERADVVHRPYQVHSDEDLAFLAQLGERVIVTNQDLISYHNPAYFEDFTRWEGYRRITRSALALADRVVFFSEHARDDAVAEDLVEPARAAVVHIGVDHSSIQPALDPRPPEAARTLPPEADLIVCIGTDFHHKNRLFALRVIEQLQRRHGWDGCLLLVGPRVARGSSSAEERRVLAQRPDLARAVLDVGPVSEAEKAWLFHRAKLVLYPTIQEGFGLVPFEAADYGTPCMWAGGTSLNELLPEPAASIVPWDAAQTADRAWELLGDAAARESNLAAIRAAGRTLTWDATAARLLDVYNETCDRPATPRSSLERRHGLLQGVLSEDAIRLIGPDGALPSDVERPLLALATHPQIGGPMFRVIKFGYRASYQLRRIGRGRRRRRGRA